MTFLFDIGRVLLDFDFETSLSRLLPPDVADPHERLMRLLAKKDEFESGAIEENAYIDWALTVLESTATPDEFRAAWRDIFTPNEPMWRNVRALAQSGHKLVLFSNINPIHSPWIYKAYPEFALFDGAVMSFEVGHVKPHAPIYQHAIAAHLLVPEQTIYIDDLPENAASGREHGFHTHQYDIANHAAFESWLAGFNLSYTPSPCH